MTLSPDLRARFLSLLPGLAPGADAGEVASFVADHHAECMAELGAVPGHDQVRAGLVRALPIVMTDAEARAVVLTEVEQALEAHDVPEVDDMGEDAAGFLRRHPAWTGLCTLELASLRDGDPRSGLEQATARATDGFRGLATHAPVDRGEVLWAMAEAAGEMAWTDLSDMLLELAGVATFADDENLGRVRLLQVFRLLEQEDPRASEAVDAVLALEALDEQTHVHALWVGAQRDRVVGRLDRAITRLEQARSMVDADDEPDVAARLDDALAAIGLGGTVAEA